MGKLLIVCNRMESVDSNRRIVELDAPPTVTQKHTVVSIVKEEPRNVDFNYAVPIMV